MLRSAISAFTRVFDSLCLRRGALLLRDPCIATHESMADVRYKEMLVKSSADDILLTTAFTGLQTNMLRPSLPPRVSIPMTCRDAVRSVSQRISMSARVRSVRSAGATSGAPSIPCQV